MKRHALARVAGLMSWKTTCARRGHAPEQWVKTEMFGRSDDCPLLGGCGPPDAPCIPTACILTSTYINSVYLGHRMHPRLLHCCSAHLLCGPVLWHMSCKGNQEGQGNGAVHD